jgi:Domain of unknown function (DUF4265)
MGIFDILKNKKTTKAAQDENVKILFRFHSDIFDEEMVETMWATIVDKNKGYYKLDNIPFYAPLVASDDIVYAEFDEREEILTYRKTIQCSGNSIIQVVLMDETKNINLIRDGFRELGCVSEKVNDGYFSIEIPAKVNYKPIKQRLDDLEQKGIIGYAESCLSDRHRQ